MPLAPMVIIAFSRRRVSGSRIRVIPATKPRPMITGTIKPRVVMSDNLQSD